MSSAAPAVTPTPLHPGIEPPRVGDWPAYAAMDKAQKLTLGGVGFPVSVPLGWACTPAADDAGKQLVRRLTGPSQWRDDLRKVANGVRSAAKF